MRLSTLKTTLPIGLLLLAATAATAQDWAGRGRAHGWVKDEDGKPVEGARVEVYLNEPGRGPEPMETNDEGRFAFGGLTGGVWTVLIDAEGFKPSQGQLQVAQFGSNKPAEITLARDPRSSISTGDELLDAGNYAEARQNYQTAMEGLDEVGRARLHSRIGDTYLAEGDLAKARSEYEKALASLAPEEQAHVLINLGNAYQADQRFAEARTQFQKALPTLDGEGKAVVLTEIAKGYYQEGEIDKAIANLEEAVEASPGNVQAIQVLADLLTRQGREEDAAAYLAQLPEDAKLPTDMVLNIGIRLFNEGEIAKALEYFDRAVAEAPENSEAYYYRGVCSLSQEDHAQARADFEKHLELAPDGAHAAEVQEFLKYLESE